MARPTLMRHPKFLRLVKQLDVSLAIGRGSLELLWDHAYENGNPNVGSRADIELLTDWRGAPGALANALLLCGGEGRSGFLDELPNGSLTVHDLDVHAPRYVKNRMIKELDREAKGLTIKEIRAAAGKKGGLAANASKRAANASNRQQNARTPAPAPAPAPARLDLIAPPAEKKRANFSPDDILGNFSDSPAPGVPTRTACADLATKPEPETTDQTVRDRNRAIAAQAKEVLDYLNEKKGSKYRDTSQIPGCIKRGATVDECKLVIDYRIANDEPDAIEKWLNAVTPFRKTNWDRTLESARQWDARGKTTNGSDPKTTEAIARQANDQVAREVAEQNALIQARMEHRARILDEFMGEQKKEAIDAKP